MMIEAAPRSGFLSATANKLRDVIAGVVETAALVYIVEVVPNDVCQAVGIAQVNRQVSVSVLISNLNPSGSFNLLARVESCSRDRSWSTSVVYDSMTQVFPSGECNRKTFLPFR